MVRSVKIKLFQPGNKKFVARRWAAGAGKYFTEANITAILTEFAEKVEKAMPDRYRMVQIGPGEFNFVRIALPECVAPLISPEQVAAVIQLA